MLSSEASLTGSTISRETPLTDAARIWACTVIFWADVEAIPSPEATQQTHVHDA